MKAALKKLFRKDGAEAPSSSSVQSPSPTSTSSTLTTSRTSQPYLAAIPERAAHVCSTLTQTSEASFLPRNGAIMVDATSPVGQSLPKSILKIMQQKCRTQRPLVAEAHPISEQPAEDISLKSEPQLRFGRRSLDLALEELPAVDHLAESGWTRALTGNIKQIAQVQGALGYLGPSAPHSPNASIIGPRTSSNHYRRRHSSALSYFGHDQTPLPTLASPMTNHPGLTSASLDDSLARDDDESAILPCVLPPALLQEAARNEVCLQVCLDTEVVLTSDTPLGRGTSGEVFQATYNGRPCAVKMLPPDTLLGSSTAELHTFVQEVVVLASLRHPSIVTFLGASLQPPHVFLLAELCQASLDAVLHRGAAATAAGCCGPFSARGMLTVALDVAKGLQYLHERTPAIVHRDLKPANILIDANGTAKISDFGLARVKTGAAICTKTPEVGSLGYMAPECFTNEDGLLSDKCDTWSLGVVLWEMVARKRPWPGFSMPEYYREVVIRKSRLPIPQDDNVCPLALRRLISSCWCDVPEERPSCSHIVAELTRMLKYCPQG